MLDRPVTLRRDADPRSPFLALLKGGTRLQIEGPHETRPFVGISGQRRQLLRLAVRRVDDGAQSDLSGWITEEQAPSVFTEETRHLVPPRHIAAHSNAAEDNNENTPRPPSRKAEVVACGEREPLLGGAYTSSVVTSKNDESGSAEPALVPPGLIQDGPVGLATAPRPPASLPPPPPSVPRTPPASVTPESHAPAANRGVRLPSVGGPSPRRAAQRMATATDPGQRASEGSHRSATAAGAGSAPDQPQHLQRRSSARRTLTPAVEYGSGAPPHTPRKKAASIDGQAGCMLHVRGIGAGGCKSEELLRQVFAPHGELVSVQIRDHTNRTMGVDKSWALVTMATEASAQSALRAAAVMAPDGTTRLQVTKFSPKKAAASTGAMKAVLREAEEDSEAHQRLKRGSVMERKSVRELAVSAQNYDSSEEDEEEADQQQQLAAVAGLTKGEEEVYRRSKQTGIPPKPGDKLRLLSNQREFTAAFHRFVRDPRVGWSEAKRELSPTLRIVCHALTTLCAFPADALRGFEGTVVAVFPLDKGRPGNQTVLMQFDDEYVAKKLKRLASSPSTVGRSTLPSECYHSFPSLEEELDAAAETRLEQTATAGILHVNASDRSRTAFMRYFEERWTTVHRGPAQGQQPVSLVRRCPSARQWNTPVEFAIAHCTCDSDGG
eukprot:COSAG01_NODE_286_length_19421_cov_123.895663_9_plen_665_part_00